MSNQSFPGSQSAKAPAADGLPTARVLNAAVAGAGLMGYWHAQAIERAGGRVLAVIDRDPGAAQRLAARLPQGAQGRVQAWPSLDAAIKEQALDVLHVCTPTTTHAALAGEGLAAGLHVLVEKPLAPTAGETGRLLQLAAAHGRLLCPVHQFVFQPGVQEAGRRLSSLGQLVRLHVEIRTAGGAGLDGAAQDQLAADILPHCLSLAEFLLPGGVQNVAWRTLRSRPGELCVLGSAGGVALLFDLSLHGRPPINRCTLVGERGTLRLNLFHGYGVQESGAVSKLHKVTQPFAAGIQELAAAAGNLGRRSLRRQGAYPGLWELILRFYGLLAQGAAPSLTVGALMESLLPEIAPAGTLAVACARDAILACAEEVRP